MVHQFLLVPRNGDAAGTRTGENIVSYADRHSRDSPPDKVSVTGIGEAALSPPIRVGNTG